MTTFYVSNSPLMLPQTLSPPADTLSSGLSTDTPKTPVDTKPRLLASTILARLSKPQCGLSTELAQPRIPIILMLYSPMCLNLRKWRMARPARPKKTQRSQSMNKALAPSLATPSITAKLTFLFPRSAVTKTYSANTSPPLVSDSTKVPLSPTLPPWARTQLLTLLASPITTLAMRVTSPNASSKRSWRSPGTST